MDERDPARQLELDAARREAADREAREIAALLCRGCAVAATNPEADARHFHPEDGTHGLQHLACKALRVRERFAPLHKLGR